LRRQTASTDVAGATNPRRPRRREADRRGIDEATQRHDKPSTVDDNAGSTPAGTTHTYRIIYLFDKQVVEAPEQEPQGHGSSRRLSARNLLELAIATATSRLGVATETSRKLLDGLRAWEQGMTAVGFALPQSIEETGGPTVRLILDEQGATHVAIGWAPEARWSKDRCRTSRAAERRGKRRHERRAQGHPADSAGPRQAGPARSRST